MAIKAGQAAYTGVQTFISTISIDLGLCTIPNKRASSHFSVVSRLAGGQNAYWLALFGVSIILYYFRLESLEVAVAAMGREQQGQRPCGNKSRYGCTIGR
jgi:hypothetical protein